MGAFFTNVHVRVPDGAEPASFDASLRKAVEATLREDGMRLAKGDERPDREIVVLRGSRWLSFYDKRAEDQDATIEDWARTLSTALATDAFSVMVHDSDVLVLSLFYKGKQRDRYDSNPEFSGKKPSKVKPEAHAAKWMDLFVGDRESTLAAAFTRKGVFAEEALQPLAEAIGADHDRLAVGYNYLREQALDPSAVVLGAVYRKQPAWTKRATGAPRFTSQWPEGDEPEVWVAPLLVGQALQLSAVVVNRGGAATGLRLEITSASSVELSRAQVVVHKPGRFQMDVYEASLVREGDRYAAELPEVALLPGFSGSLDITDAPMDAVMDVHHAGRLQVNLYGTALSSGRGAMEVTFTPLANVSGARTECVSFEVEEVRGAPLRARELHPNILEPLQGDTHTYVLVVVDAPVEIVKAHALALLSAVRAELPKRRWEATVSDERFDVGEGLKATGSLGEATVWAAFEKAIRGAKQCVTATSGARSYSPATTSAFDVTVGNELGTIAISIAAKDIEPDAAERMFGAAIDAIAKAGVLVQAVLAHWAISHATGPTPYEAAVGLHDVDSQSTRAWATRWIRAIGPGQLWLGKALRERAGALPGVVEIGPTARLAVTDVAATERQLAVLLPSEADLVAFRDARAPSDA